MFLKIKRNKTRKNTQNVYKNNDKSLTPTKNEEKNHCLD